MHYSVEQRRRMMSQAEAYETAEARRRADDLVQRIRGGILTKQYFLRLFPDFREFAIRWRCRDIITKECCWCVPTMEWLASITHLTQRKRVLEVCAGRGTITKLMLDRGEDWTATDIEPAAGHVLEADALAAVKEHQPDIIFASWIPYESSLDGELADFGIPFIVVGEGHGGCTGDGSLWTRHDPVDAVDLCEGFEDVPNWDGIHDFTSLVNWPEG